MSVEGLDRARAIARTFAYSGVPHKAVARGWFENARGETVFADSGVEVADFRARGRSLKLTFDGHTEIVYPVLDGSGRDPVFDFVRAP
jgi:hypothetical protein